MVATMSLNDVYRQRYVPNTKSQALEVIEAALFEAKEKSRKSIRQCEVKTWQTLHARLNPTRKDLQFTPVNFGRIAKILAGNNLPPINSGIEPSIEALIEFRVKHARIDLDYTLLRAIRDACMKS
ncbi:hypothetical protein N9A45_01140 [bacterium]|nr:hypothetical protein [bacterium]